MPRYLGVGILLLLSLTQETWASYIMGGTINMTQVGATVGRYNVNLTLLVDLNATLPNTLIRLQSSGFIVARVHRKRDNVKIADLQIPFKNFVDFQFTDYPTCSQLRDVKIRAFNYTLLTTLNPSNYSDSQGYYIAWERCCRNDDLSNIQTPENASMVLYMEFPSLVMYPQYSSPVFDLTKSEYICLNKPFSFKLTATDADANDQLRYRIVNPMNGFNDLVNYDRLVFPGPYPFINWLPGLSSTKSIPGSKPLTVNTNTGLLEVNPDKTGIYLFTLECTEFRSGTQIGLVRCDFQFPVVNCSKNTPPIPVIRNKGVVVSSLEYCKNETILLETESKPEWFFQWQKDGLDLVGETNSNLSVKNDGSYTVRKYLKNVCSNDTISQNIELKEATLIIPKISADETQICEGNNTMLRIDSHSDYIFEWTYEKNRLSIQNEISVNQAGWYSVKAKKNISGCYTTTDSIKIEFKPKIELSVTPTNTTIDLGSSVKLNTKVNQKNVSFSYTPPTFLDDYTSSSPIATPAYDIKYTLTATSEAGCIASKEIIIKVIDIFKNKLFIPNAFSPNADGENDFFKIGNIEKFNDCVVIIFNRWGQEIFRSAKGYPEPWDGSFDGKKVPMGIYTYKIDYNESNLNPTTGSIMVLY